MVKEYTTRDIKLETIRRSVCKCLDIGLPAIKERIITECSFWWGLRRQSAQELINQLISEEYIFDDDGDLWSIKRWNKIKDAKERDYLKGEEAIQVTFGDIKMENNKS